MDLLITILLSVLILILIAMVQYCISMRSAKKRLERLKKERSLLFDEAISKVKSGDGWLLAYNYRNLWEDELFWLQSDIHPKDIFRLHDHIMAEAYYVVRNDSFQESLKPFDMSVKERFYVCYHNCDRNFLD